MYSIERYSTTEILRKWQSICQNVKYSIAKEENFCDICKKRIEQIDGMNTLTYPLFIDILHDFLLINKYKVRDILKINNNIEFEWFHFYRKNYDHKIYCNNCIKKASLFLSGDSEHMFIYRKNFINQFSYSLKFILKDFKKKNKHKKCSLCLKKGGKKKVYFEIPIEVLINNFLISEKKTIFDCMKSRNMKIDNVGPWIDFFRSNCELSIRCSGCMTHEGDLIKEMKRKEKEVSAVYKDPLRDSVHSYICEHKRNLINKGEYVCLGCGTKDNLTIDHLVTFSDLKKQYLEKSGNKLEDVVEDEDKLAEFSEYHNENCVLRTLCGECHDCDTRIINTFYKLEQGLSNNKYGLDIKI